MLAKAIVSGVVLVLMAVLLACSIEYFIPLSKKADMDIACRNALLKMENSGGISETNKDELEEKLEALGMTNVRILGTEAAKQGEMLALYVECDYHYDRLTGLFRRESINQRMIYDKSSMSRKVVN